MVLPLTLIIGSYLIGSIPTGLLVGLYVYGIDIRQSGSGNIGTTNALRAIGTSGALIVLAGDIAKGMIVILIAGSLYPSTPTIISHPERILLPHAIVLACVAMAAFIGNNFSIYLNFRGGKGIGITAGIILAMTPVIALLLLIVWLIILLITRYVSLGSVIIALLFPILMYYFYGEVTPYLIFSLIASILAIISHRANIKRLLEGTELRFGDKGARGEGRA